MSDTSGGMPGTGAMNDTLEFVRNFWGAMKIPGMAMPSMSPDDINKHIADLRAVESWLQMNMNMLRTTIQTLEVQSATLSALQSMSDSFARSAKTDESDGGKPAFDSPFAKPAEAAGHGEIPDPSAFVTQFANPAAWWSTVQDQFAKAVESAMPPPQKTTRKRSPSTDKKSGSTPKKTTRKKAPKA